MNTNPLGRLRLITLRCQRKNCDNVATCSPVVRIPAKGCPIPEHDPLIAQVGIRLCDGCFSRTRVGEFLSPEFKKVVKVTCNLNHAAKPDFKRAFLEKGKLP